MAHKVTLLTDVTVDRGGYRSSMTHPTRPTVPTGAQLRRGALGVSVLHDVDVEANRQGLWLTGDVRVWVPWGECRAALRGADPESNHGRRRLARWLLARRWAADLDREDLRSRLRPVGLPAGHELHHGSDWVRATVLGDALDLGLGAVGLDPTDPDRVVPLPRTALTAARLDLRLTWDEAHDYLERMGTLAASRLAAKGEESLRPLGDCDVITLLGARSLRASLARSREGMATVVAPMLRRGWTRLALVDPAFAPAAWMATASEERGFPRPLLVTPDEVVLCPDGGRPEQLVTEHLTDRPWQRKVLYR
jgi:hypothetical protein